MDTHSLLETLIARPELRMRERFDKSNHGYRGTSYPLNICVGVLTAVAKRSAP